MTDHTIKSIVILITLYYILTIIWYVNVNPVDTRSIAAPVMWILVPCFYYGLHVITGWQYAGFMSCEEPPYMGKFLYDLLVFLCGFIFTLYPVVVYLLSYLSFGPDLAGQIWSYNSLVQCIELVTVLVLIWMKYVARGKSTRSVTRLDILNLILPLMFLFANYPRRQIMPAWKLCLSYASVGLIGLIYWWNYAQVLPDSDWTTLTGRFSNSLTTLIWAMQIIYMWEHWLIDGHIILKVATFILATISWFNVSISFTIYCILDEIFV